MFVIGIFNAEKELIQEGIYTRIVHEYFRIKIIGYFTNNNRNNSFFRQI